MEPALPHLSIHAVEPKGVYSVGEIVVFSVHRRGRLHRFVKRIDHIDRTGYYLTADNPQYTRIWGPIPAPAIEGRIHLEE